jgi:hypothetical protein
MIGYFKEFKCKEKDLFFEVMIPTLYASGTANNVHIRKMKETYDVIVRDLF